MTKGGFYIRFCCHLIVFYCFLSVFCSLTRFSTDFCPFFAVYFMFSVRWERFLRTFICFLLAHKVFYCLYCVFCSLRTFSAVFCQFSARLQGFLLSLVCFLLAHKVFSSLRAFSAIMSFFSACGWCFVLTFIRFQLAKNVFYGWASIISLLIFIFCLGSRPHETKELNRLWSVKTRTTAKDQNLSLFFRHTP